jgi:phosphatidylcholine synthase
VHPLRVVRLRGLTIAMTCAWFAFAAMAILENLAPPAWVSWGLIATAVYFLALPLLRDSPLARDRN